MQALADGSLVTCRCHGTSGSCTLRTCWITLPPFRNVTNRLMTMYRRAAHVDLVRAGYRSVFFKLRRRHTDSLRQPPEVKTASGVGQKKLPARRLVYLVRSPDFCQQYTRHGLLGRTCGYVERMTSSTSERRVGRHDDDSAPAVVTSDVNHCKSMCCGRGFVVRSDVVVRRCRCRFRWCCDVSCQTCSDVIETRTCR